jgi:hypothetical protein
MTRAAAGRRLDVVTQDGSQHVAVGVRLAQSPDDVGEWLADATAFEAAGAEALWIDVTPGPELDPLALTAALAALTHRSLLVTSVPAPDSPRTLARTLATLGRLGRGRLRIVVDTIPLADIGPGLAVFRRIPGDPEAFEEPRDDNDAHRWILVASPDSRATWRETLLNAAERGYQGLMVPDDPRLLDILRNPDDLGDRRDLHLSVG